MRKQRFNKILVANRGEIAIRVFRAAAELGIRTVAIFSEEDRLSLHRYKADEAYQVGKGLGPVRAYLAIDQIIELAREKQADAIHPGYGFLSENADFARACEDAGITFIGPSAELIAMMGSKVAARHAAEKIGLPLIPGTHDPVNLKQAAAFAQKIGFPVMLKSVFGGGGRGMRVVRSLRELKRVFREAENEARNAFGRPEIFVEKLVERPKHIEVQVLADHYGNVIHCFERDCSIQRRHQKVIEIAPSPTLSRTAQGQMARAAMLDAAVELARSTGYTNAGTVEFMYQPEDNQFYFMEMNTRIQVEHTVTEMITGLDLVKTQIRIAEGCRLSDPEIGVPDQGEVQYRGTAIQCRITTEDPAANFIPDYGRLVAYRSAAGHGVRLDAGSAHNGAVITPYYDSLLVKLTTFGRNLAEAAERTDRALSEFRIRGVKTNIGFLRAVMKEPEFLEGDFRTDYLERHPELRLSTDHFDRTSKVLQYLADVTVNGNPAVKGAARPKKLPVPVVPEADHAAPVSPGTKQILEERGVDGLVQWIKSQKRLLVTDTTFRDAHQSLLATRIRTYDMLAVAESMVRREPRMFSYEMWGGATFDTALKFLKEDPWQRLADLRAAMPNALTQMLLRGSNAVGYTSYPDKTVKEFVRLAAEAGMDLFRVFDAFNWTKSVRVAVDAVRNAGKIAEAAICYTGNIEDPKRTKYSLKYYVKLAREYEKAGAQILAIKDMAGLLRPFSARTLIKALRNETDLPLHLHTHDTSGVQAATLLLAAEAGVHIVDGALASMSGVTSQVNLNSLVAMFEHHERSTGLDLSTLNEFSSYWEDVRRYYAPFESELRASSGEVYFHEMPGGQYTNLYEQAQAMGLAPRWNEVVKSYALANKLFGDIVKVTPSSKVVGDMALFMVANNLNESNFFEKAESLSFPLSVVGMMRGDLGQAPGGFPKQLRDLILKDEKPGSKSKRKAVDLGRLKTEIEKKIQHGRSDPPVRELDVMSYVMHPQSALEFLRHRKEFGDTSVLPTAVYFYGMQPGEEISLEVEPGRTLYVKLFAVSEPDAEGFRTLFFEVNGYPRDVRVRDRSQESARRERPKADPDNLHHVGSSIPGRVVEVRVKPGDAVQKGDTLCLLEAMKMETSVVAPRPGIVADVHAGAGDQISAGDLLVTYK